MKNSRAENISWNPFIAIDAPVRVILQARLILQRKVGKSGQLPEFGFAV